MTHTFTLKEDENNNFALFDNNSKLCTLSTKTRLALVEDIEKHLKESADVHELKMMKVALKFAIEKEFGR